jgi:hypothetical protein
MAEDEVSLDKARELARQRRIAIKADGRGG